MASRKGSPRRTITVSSGALVLAILSSLLIGCFSPARYEVDIGDDVDFPAIYTVDDSFPTDWPDAQVRLNADGTAEVRDVAAGSIEEVDGVPCVAGSEIMSGSGNWTAGKSNRVIVTVGKLSTVLAGHLERFSGADWNRVGIVPCERPADDLWFWLE